MHVVRDKTVTTHDALSSGPSDIHLVNVLREASLPGVLADAIEQRIVSGELQPGDRINELQLARHYGVSRGPLRAALGTLTAQGLLEQVKNKGCFVRLVDVREASEIFELRGILERAAIDAFCTLDATRQHALLAEFDHILADMTLAVCNGDGRGYFRLNLMFHETIIRAHPNRKLHATYAGLVRDLTLARRQSLRSPDSLARSMEEHRGIVAALHQGDAGRAGTLLKEHIRRGRRRCEQFKEQA